jgi:hypothetical protein
MHRYVVVARGESAVRVPHGSTIEIPTASPLGQAMVRFRTRFSDNGFASPVPRELWAEVEGEADCSLDEATNRYWNIANGFTPALAVITNGPVDDLTVDLAFDATDGQAEHAFFQNFLTFDSGPLHHGRNLPVQEAMEVLGALEASPHKSRLLRAVAFYREALRYLKPGQETLFVVYLWMAVEALTKVALRTACAQAQCSEDELVVRWSLAKPGDDEETLKVAKRGLDGEARRRLIFHGDGECQRDTVNASDGFEHGFEELDTVRKLAIKARDAGAAQHVRRAIFELMELDPATTTTLTSGRYDKPRANWPITRYMRGTLIGPAHALAAAGEAYPMVKWSPQVKEFVKADSGAYNVTFDENMTLSCGAEVQFRPERFEVWGPENDPTR